jgi:hypothetical protein
MFNTLLPSLFLFLASHSLFFSSLSLPSPLPKGLPPSTADERRERELIDLSPLWIFVNVVKSKDDERENPTERE